MARYRRNPVVHHYGSRGEAAVDLRLKSSSQLCNINDVVYWGPSGASYVIVYADRGEFYLGGLPVDLVAVDDQGRVTRLVSNADVERARGIELGGRLDPNSKLGEALSAARSFGLEPRRVLMLPEGPSRRAPGGGGLAEEEKISPPMQAALWIGGIAALGVGAYFLLRPKPAAAAAASVKAGVKAGYAAEASPTPSVVISPYQQNYLNCASVGTFIVTLPDGGTWDAGNFQSDFSDESFSGTSLTVITHNQGGNITAAWVDAQGTAYAPTISVKGYC